MRNSFFFCEQEGVFQAEFSRARGHSEEDCFEHCGSDRAGAEHPQREDRREAKANSREHTGVNPDTELSPFEG